MKMITLSEAQKHLPRLVKQAQREMIGLTDEEGNLVGLLAGVDEDSLDDILVQIPGFMEIKKLNRGWEAHIAQQVERTEGVLGQEPKKLLAEDL